MKTVLLFVVFCVVTTIFADELSKFNDLRRNFAEDNGIPNMWADIAESIPCPTEAGADWRYYYAIGGKNGAEFNTHLFQWFNTYEKTNASLVTAQVKQWEKGTAFFLEYVNPIQTEIACVDKRNNIGMTVPIAQSSKRLPGTQCGPNGERQGRLCVPK